MTDEGKRQAMSHPYLAISENDHWGRKGAGVYTTPCRTRPLGSYSQRPIIPHHVPGRKRRCSNFECIGSADDDDRPLRAGVTSKPPGCRSSQQGDQPPSLREYRKFINETTRKDGVRAKRFNLAKRGVGTRLGLARHYGDPPDQTRSLAVRLLTSHLLGRLGRAGGVHGSRTLASRQPTCA